MHVVWLDLVVALPLAALLLLVLVRRRSRRPLRGLQLAALAVAFLAPVGAYASFVEPERLELERAELALPAERASERPLRIGLLADIQCEEVGPHEREAVERLMAERPDLILLSGDYHQGAPAKLERELPALRGLFGHLEAPGGVFAVQGDSESVDEVRRIAAGTGVRVLADEIARVRVGNRRVSIAGLNRDYWEPSAGRLLRRFESAPGRRDVGSRWHTGRTPCCCCDPTRGWTSRSPATRTGARCSCPTWGRSRSHRGCRARWVRAACTR